MLRYTVDIHDKKYSHSVLTIVPRNFGRYCMLGTGKAKVELLLDTARVRLHNPQMLALSY